MSTNTIQYVPYNIREKKKRFLIPTYLEPEEPVTSGEHGHHFVLSDRTDWPLEAHFKMGSFYSNRESQGRFSGSAFAVDDEADDKGN